MTAIDREAELSRMAELGERGVEGAAHFLGRDDEHTPPVLLASRRTSDGTGGRRRSSPPTTRR